VRGEAFLLRQAVRNLLQNAVDFSPHGSAVTATVAAFAGQVRLTVVDAGPGVPAFALPRLGERFFSLPRPDTGRKGTGLGLALVR
jgi:two-component system sensor histidine kinase CreC